MDGNLCIFAKKYCSRCGSKVWLKFWLSSLCTQAYSLQQVNRPNANQAIISVRRARSWLPFKCCSKALFRQADILFKIIQGFAFQVGNSHLIVDVGIEKGAAGLCQAVAIEGEILSGDIAIVEARQTDFVAAFSDILAFSSTSSRLRASSTRDTTSLISR